MAYENVVVALNPGAEDRTLAVPAGAGWTRDPRHHHLGRRAGRRPGDRPRRHDRPAPVLQRPVLAR